MARDVIHLTLASIRKNLSDITGIPTGNIWVDKPSYEYVNTDTFNDLPAIGIIELESMPGFNNYGKTFMVSTAVSGVYTQYSPVGEVVNKIQIEVWTKTQSERRNYRTLLNHWFQQNTLISTLDDDVLDGQYFSMKVIDVDKNEQPPYILYYVIETIIQDFKEEEVYSVESITVNTALDIELNVTADNTPTITRTIT